MQLWRELFDLTFDLQDRGSMISIWELSLTQDLGNGGTSSFSTTDGLELLPGL